MFLNSVQHGSSEGISTKSLSFSLWPSSMRGVNFDHSGLIICDSVIH